MLTNRAVGGWSRQVNVLSVGGISSYLQTLLEEDPQLVRLSVTGEVSSCSAHRNGHLFLTLTDPDTGDALKAVVWQSQVAELIHQPEVGQQVIGLGQMRTYAKGSYYQLQISQIYPAGEGLLALRTQQLRARLLEEGVFDPAQKRSLPSHPECVAVVTSEQAAAWGDIQRTLSHRYPGLSVLLSPAIVQGEQAPASIVAGIRRVERDGRAEVLILARGGGAVEDLYCFNDERVVRAISTCRIPVITGIGHQRDETLADLAADHAAHTPTAAAERAVPDLAELIQAHAQLRLDLKSSVKNELAIHQRHLTLMHNRIRTLPLPTQIQTQQIQQRALKQRLITITRQQLEQAIAHQQALSNHLQALDPQAVLRRGYALILTEQGKQVQSAEIPSGTRLTLVMAIGKVQVKVE